jgi:hypothetical protein
MRDALVVATSKSEGGLVRRVAKKCANPRPSYKKGHEKTCSNADHYKPPYKELMSVLESKDLDKIPKSSMIDFV